MSFFDAVAADDVTLHGLEKWTCHMYEQLGWMTLANEFGREDKVGSYITSIKKLKNSIELRLKIITSEDAKLDLTNLLSKVKHLFKITSKLFNKEHIKKTICNKCTLLVEPNEIEQNNNEQINIRQDGGTKNLKSKNSKLTHVNELSKKILKNLLKNNLKKLLKKLLKILLKILLKT